MSAAVWSETSPSFWPDNRFLPGALAAALLLAMATGNPARAQTAPISGYMNCARALGVAQNDGFAIIAGERQSGKGIYIYTDRNAYFLQLGRPQIETPHAREFLFRLGDPASGSGELFLSYREEAGSQDGISKARDSIAYQTSPPAAFRQKLYRRVALESLLDDRAREIISQNLRERVGRIKIAIDDKNRYFTPAEASASFETDRVVYRTKLESCRIEGDRRLQLAVTDQIEKLEKGFPGATIWETQIDGRSTLLKPRRTPGD